MAVFPSPTKVADGVLLVNVQSNLTLVPSPPAIGGAEVESLPGVAVAVYQGFGSTATVHNITDSLGQAQEDLPPGTYTAKLLDWRFENLSTTVEISSDKVTDLNVTLNATSYVIQSANIADPDFSGWAVSWGQIYVQLDANWSVSSSVPSTYLDTQYPANTPISRIEQPGVTPITISASGQSNGSRWVQIQVITPLNISSIKSMSILTLRSEFMVGTNAVQ